MVSRTLMIIANALLVVSCMVATEPEPDPIEEPCFIADTVGRSAEFNRDLPCWLFIHECRVYQVCVARGQPGYSMTAASSVVRSGTVSTSCP